VLIIVQNLSVPTDRRVWMECRALVATGFVVYEDGPAVARLRALAAETLAAEPDPSPEFLARRRYAVATSFEDAEDVAHTDPEVCALLLGRAIEGAVELRFWSARRWQPRSKDILTALDALDPALARQARLFYRAADTGERLRLARSIVSQTADAERFFEWESPIEVLPA